MFFKIIIEKEEDMNEEKTIHEFKITRRVKANIGYGGPTWLGTRKLIFFTLNTFSGFEIELSLNSNIPDKNNEKMRYNYEKYNTLSVDETKKFIERTDGNESYYFHYKVLEILGLGPFSPAYYFYKYTGHVAQFTPHYILKRFEFRE